MNADYAILADITCDLSPELRQRFGVDGYLKTYMTTPDGREVAGSLDMSEAEVDAFYASLKANSKGYKSAAPSVEDAASYFETFLAQGRDVLALSISSKLSATYNVMKNAGDAMRAKYPDRKIFVVDSMRYSLALGLLTTRACELRAGGHSIDDAVATLESTKSVVHQMGPIDDLFWVASKGRVSHAAAFFGSMAGIKPMGDFDSDGMVTVLTKVSGYEKAYAATVAYIEKTIRSAGEQTILVGHSARRAQAETMASRIRDTIHPKDVIVSDIYPMSGINAGPGIVAAYYLGCEISDLKYETEVMHAIVRKG